MRETERSRYLKGVVSVVQNLVDLVVAVDPEETLTWKHHLPQVKFRVFRHDRRTSLMKFYEKHLVFLHHVDL